MAKPFLIMFVARSGSTAVLGYLRKHPDVVMRAEAFGAPTLPDGSEQTDDNRIRFLRKFWGPFKGGAEPTKAPWRGFKWQIDSNNSQFTRPRRLIRVMSEYGPRIVVLKRDNILKQAISTLNARRLLELTKDTDKPSAHVTVDNAAIIGRLKSDKLRVDVRELGQIIGGIRRSRRNLEKLASEIPERKEMRYEDFVADPRAFVAELCTFIGLAPDQITGETFLKITPDNLAEAIENYEELRQFAKASDLEAML